MAITDNKPSVVSQVIAPMLSHILLSGPILVTVSRDARINALSNIRTWGHGPRERRLLFRSVTFWGRGAERTCDWQGARACNNSISNTPVPVFSVV